MKDLKMHFNGNRLESDSPVIEAAYDFMSRYSSNYCRYECRTQCCSIDMHLIRLNQESIPLFADYGVPFVDVSDGAHKFIDLIKNKVKEPTYENCVNEGAIVRFVPELFRGHRSISKIIKETEIQNPSVVIDNDGKIFLYGNGLCPLYGDGCKAHDDDRRPSDCKLYPLSPEPGIIEVRRTCDLSRDETFMNHLRKIVQGHFKVRID
ncbi:MAG: hypothetical protein KKE20_01740 [Nanoarchaeota archaeon]|nr:hypothetical protein [Nanoarchaeota archaeon]